MKHFYSNVASLLRKNALILGILGLCASAAIAVTGDGSAEDNMTPGAGLDPVELNVLPEDGDAFDLVSLEAIIIDADGKYINPNTDVADCYIELRNQLGVPVMQLNWEEVVKYAVWVDADGDEAQTEEDQVAIVGYRIDASEFVTDNGEYTFVIPEGFFQVLVEFELDGETEEGPAPNAAVEYTWTVGANNTEIEVLPEMDEDLGYIMASALETVTIGGFDGENVILTNNDDLFITLTNGMGVQLAQWNADEVREGAVENDADDPFVIGYKLNVAQYITDSGEYTLTIPAGMFEIANQNVEGAFAKNFEKVVTWVVKVNTMEIEVLPEMDEDLGYIMASGLEKVTIGGLDGEEIIPGNDDKEITLVNGMGITIANWTTAEVLEGAVKDEDVCIGYVLDVAQYITDSGNYSLNIPEGMFEVKNGAIDGVFSPNAEKVVEWVVKVNNVALEVLPEEDPELGYILSSALEAVTIGGYDGQEVLLNNNDEDFVTLTNSMGAVLAQWSCDEVREGAVKDLTDEGEEGVVIGYKLDVAQYITDSGVYTLNIPEGMFDVKNGELDGVFSPNFAASVTWTVKVNYVALEVLPEQDAELGYILSSALEEVTIGGFEGEEVLLNNNDDDFITLVNSKGVTIAQWSCDEVREGAVKDLAEETEDGEEVEGVVIGYKLNVAQFITDSGEYTLNVPAGMFDVKNGELDGVFSPNFAASVTWTVKVNNVALEVLPEQDAELGYILSSALEAVTIGGFDGEEVLLNNNDEHFITLVNSKGVTIAQWSCDEVREGAVKDLAEETEDGKEVEGVVIGYKLDVAQYITDSGEYTLNIPEGMFDIKNGEIDGVFSPNFATSVTWTVKVNNVALEVLPEQDAELGYIMASGLEEVTIGGFDGEEVLLNNNDDLFITLVNNMGVTIAQWNADEVREGAVKSEAEEGEEAVVIGYKLNVAQYITDSGLYTLNIPEGMFDIKNGEIDGVFSPNFAVTISWTVKVNNVAIEILPEQDEDLGYILASGLEEVTIGGFEGEEILLNNSDDLFITLTNNMGVTIAQWGADEVREGAVKDLTDEGEEGVVIGYKLNVAQYITDSGVYTLNVPEGMFDVKNGELDGVFSPNLEASVTWTVKVNNVALEVLPEQDPEIGFIMSGALEEVTIGGFDGEEVLLNNNDLMITLVNQMGVEIASWSADEVREGAVKDLTDEGEEGVVIGYKLNVAQYITDSGVYTLNIPEGMFDVKNGELDGVFSPNYEVSVTWTVVAQFAELEVLPEQDPESEYIASTGLEKVAILCDGREVLLNNNDDLIVLKNEMDVTIAQWNCDEVRAGAAEEEGICIGYEINVAEHITADGVYTLVIPEGMFDIASEGLEGAFSKNLEKTVVWTVKYVEEDDSVASIFGDDVNNFNVVSLNGVNVVRNGKAADLKNLEGGLYIINGKKVYIRK